MNKQKTNCIPVLKLVEIERNKTIKDVYGLLKKAGTAPNQIKEMLSTITGLKPDTIGQIVYRVLQAEADEIKSNL